MVVLEHLGATAPQAAQAALAAVLLGAITVSHNQDVAAAAAVSAAAAEMGLLQ